MTNGNRNKLNVIQSQMEITIEKETGAKTEVTIANDVLIYTEDLNLVEEIKTLIDKVQTFVKKLEYEADDELPAGITLVYSLG